MRRTDARLRALRPDVAAPREDARDAARARLQDLIDVEPAGRGAPTRARSARPGSRGRMGWVVSGTAVGVAVAVIVVALLLLGRGAGDRGSAAGRPAGGSIVVAGGRPLSSLAPALARALRTRYRHQLASGDTLRSSIDPALQRTAERALSRVTPRHPTAPATVVAMNPDTGAVAALTSVRGSIGRATEVGSVFDPFTALVVLQDGSWVPTETYDDTGSLCVGAHRVCLHNAEHMVGGALTLRAALAREDELVFDYLGLLIRGQGRPVVSPTSLGLGRRTGIDLPGESAGGLPGSSRPALTALAGDGLGSVFVTPIQLAVADAALANGGDVVVPRVVGSAVAPGGAVTSARAAAARLRLRAAALSTVRTGLRANAAGVRGATAATFRGFPYAVHGLAGSVLDFSGQLQRHDARTPVDAWYAGWVPARAGRPPLVVVVSVPDGGFGAISAAPVAREVFSQWEIGRPGPWRPGDSRAQ